MIDERLYWLSFSVFPGIGPGRFKVLINSFGSAENAWKASFSDLKEIFGEKLTEKLDEFRNNFSPLDYFKKLKEENVWFLTLKDKEYPELLAKIKNPPFVLFGKGNIRNLSAEVAFENFRVRNAGNSSSESNFKGAKAHSESFESSPRQALRTIAVVGARRTTQYGREVTRLLTADFVGAGFTIVLGLPIGID